MLIVDVSENKEVFEHLEKKIGKSNFKIEQIGTYDCYDGFFPIKEGYCVDEDELLDLLESDININKDLCKSCKKHLYVRFADFTNDTKSFFYERKTVMDFINSRRSRLYEQMNKIDTFVECRKGLILEGMGEYTPIYDSYWRNIDKGVLKGLSPLQQVLYLGGKKEWTMSFIRELKMRDMEFVQTWNLDETIDFLVQCDEGYDHEPKLRILPKRYPEISLEQNILVLIPHIGKKTSENLLKEYGSLPNIIRALPKIKGKSKTLDILKEVFIGNDRT